MNRWLDGLKRRLGLVKVKQAKKPTRRRLGLEALEDRLAPAAGALDPTFGTGGIATTALGTGNSIAQSMVVQSDGKIVVAGTAKEGGPNEFALTRYNANGTLDTTFGSGGEAVIALGSIDSQANSVAVQSDGKIVEAGYANNGSNNEFALTRYNADGTLDTTFGNNGAVLTPVGSGNSSVQSVAVQADGKIVAAGYANNGFALARYTANGTLDTTFGTGGEVLTAVGAVNSGAQSVAVQTDGKIVEAGYALQFGLSEFALARYNTNGTLDTTFGSGGEVLTVVGSSSGQANSVAVQSDGKIIAAGYTLSGNGVDEFALTRYTPSGTLDASFGAGGEVLTPVNSSFSSVQSVAVQADGKVVAAGYAATGYGSTQGIALARYNANGILDTTFGTGGEVFTAAGSSDSQANGVAVQADGAVVAAGFAFTSNNTQEFAVARYQGAPTVTVSAGPNASTTSLVSSSVAAPYPGQAVTLSVTVRGAAGMADNGSVTFYDTVGSALSVLGTGTISGGVASLTLSSLTTGSHSITAGYGGNSYFTASGSPTALALSVAGGTHASTTSAVRSSVAAPYPGQSITLSVSVSGAAGMADNGTVTFYDSTNGTPTALGTGTVSGGVASLTLSTLAAGTHPITATYGGNAYFGASTTQSTLALPVAAGSHASTTSAVSSSVAVPYPGQSVTLSVTVGGAAGKADNGTVTFFDSISGNPIALGTATVSGGVASLTLSTLALGNHTISATYGGNAYFAASSSQSTLAVSVAAGSHASTTSLVSSSLAVLYPDQPVTLTVSVSGAAGKADNGTVTFYDTFNGGTSVLGTGTVSNGVASLTVSDLTSGQHYLTAHYAGNAYFAASDSL